MIHMDETGPCSPLMVPTGWEAQVTPEDKRTQI